MKAEKGLNILARMLLILFVISATILPVLTTKAQEPEYDGYYSRFILHNAIALAFIVIILFRALIRRKFKKNFLVGVLLFEEKGIARILGNTAVYLCIGLIIYIYQLYKGKALYDKKYWTYALKFNIPLIPYYLSQMIFINSRLS